MRLTSNETAWAIMIVSLAYGTALAWITIKAQHAKNIAELTDDIKNKIARFVLRISNLLAVGLLLYELFTSKPVSRADIFFIVWGVVILFLTIILRLYDHLIRVTISTIILRSLHREEYEQLKSSLPEKEFRQWL